LHSQWPNLQGVNQKLLVAFILVALLALSVRVLTLQFMRAHLNDPGWFQTGSYAKFDRQARDILDGRQRLFWIDDASRTDLAQYPPLFPWFVATIYKLTGERSAYAVQSVQWFVDLFISLVLIVGIAVTGFGWRVGLFTGLLVALSPLLALYGVSPSADPPTMWFVLGGNWCLLLAAKRRSAWWALGAGLLLGIACWFRVNPLYLGLAWAVVLLIFVKTDRAQRIKLAVAVMLGTLIVISPIVIRNYLVFPIFTPTGGTIGANLWEGLGETELGRAHGFMFGDDKLIERERVKLGLPADFPIEAQWPDGIRRDRERVTESTAFIRQHLVWYAGVMLHRMWGMLRVAGEPLPYYGTSGINVTGKKCLSPERQDGLLAAGVKLLGMIQSVTRYLFLPLALLGIVVATRKTSPTASLLAVTILYYLVPGTVGHTEIRYMLPMHALLTVFAAIGLGWLVGRFIRPSVNPTVQ
jgi:4-amino-4-deoxy-L-arabinose transferase-like glycosyltransferase